MSGVPAKIAKTDRNANARYCRSSDAIIIKCGSDATNAVDNARCPLSENAINMHCGSGTPETLSKAAVREYDVPYPASMEPSSVMRSVRSISSPVGALYTTKPSSDKGDLCAWGSAGTEKLSCVLFSKDLKSKLVDGSETGTGEQPVATASAALANQVMRPKSGGGLAIKDKAQEKNSDGTISPRISLHNQNLVDNGPALEAIWKGSFEIFHNEADVRFCEAIVAHPSVKVSRKAFEFSRKIGAVLMFRMHPRSAFWPKTFENERPGRNDIALYFYPRNHERSKRQYSSLLKFIENQGLVMRSCMGDVEMLVFPSKLLDVESQKLNGSYFLWGVYSRTKGKSVAARADLSSPPPDASKR